RRPTQPERGAPPMTFSDWMAAVDAALRDRIGLSTGELSGVDYHGLYLDGFTPGEVAQMAIVHALDGRSRDINDLDQRPTTYRSTSDDLPRLHVGVLRRRCAGSRHPRRRAARRRGPGGGPPHTGPDL